MVGSRHTSISASRLTDTGDYGVRVLHLCFHVYKPSLRVCRELLYPAELRGPSGLEMFTPRPERASRFLLLNSFAFVPSCNSPELPRHSSLVHQGPSGSNVILFVMSTLVVVQSTRHDVELCLTLRYFLLLESLRNRAYVARTHLTV